MIKSSFYTHFNFDNSLKSQFIKNLKIKLISISSVEIPCVLYKLISS